MTLNNVELRTEVLQEEVESPFIFKRIFIQELKLNIPWASLRYQPAKVSIRANRICKIAWPLMRPLAQIRVRNAEVVLWAGGDRASAGSAAAEGGAGADDVRAEEQLDNSQMSWVYALVTQALANLIVDINGLTFRVEMLRQPTAAASGHGWRR